MTDAKPSRIADIFAGLLIIALAVHAVLQVVAALKMPLFFDDSYMFYRYAMNIRHGLGMSWNLDAIHTYGETAPLWGFFVIILSYLPIPAAQGLILGSWACGLGAIIAMAWAVSRNAESKFMGSTLRVLPLVALPLAWSPIFTANALTGMETMLAVLLAAVFVGLAVGWAHGTTKPQWMVVAGVALFLTRPETALAVCLVPLMFLLLGRDKPRSFFIFSTLFVCGVALDLLICKIYFGTPLPLSFYMKSGHAYEGYHTAWHPLSHALLMLVNCGVFLALIALLARAAEWKIVVSLVVPALITFAYLCTVTQIMGWQSRYHIPYFPFFVVPALLVVDRRLKDLETSTPIRWIAQRGIMVGGTAVAGVVVTLLIGQSRLTALVEVADAALERRPYIYDPVRVEVGATIPLPRKTWYENIHELGDVLLGPLPKGVTIAASEVGYLGSANLQANVIDIEGLNDNQIALHGFDVDDLVRRAPDMIWMPHPDYTFQRGLMMTNRAFFEHYDLYAGVGGYGLALRKDSPLRSAINQRMDILWREFYPGLKMQDYLVRSTSWSGRRYKPTVEEDKQRRLIDSGTSGQ